jgi:N6-L-threonylcarbamoyladenine synthase
VKCPELEFSLSGVQNKVQQYHQNHTQEETAAYCLNSVCFAVKKATENALAQYPGLEVVLSGGVASNSRLRQVMELLGAVFGAPQYSTDNAMGVAILADRLK